MKIQTIQAEAKLSRNFQSFGVTMTATLDSNENPDEATAQLQKQVTDLCEEQIDRYVKR